MEINTDQQHWPQQMGYLGYLLRRKGVRGASMGYVFVQFTIHKHYWFNFQIGKRICFLNANIFFLENSFLLNDILHLHETYFIFIFHNKIHIRLH
jgi:hypothetical protein